MKGVCTMSKFFFVLAANNGHQKKIKCFTSADKFGEALRACAKKKGIGYSAMEFEVMLDEIYELQPQKYYNRGTSGFTLRQMEKTVCKVATSVLGHDAIINWPDDFPEWVDVPVRFCRKTSTSCPRG
jgi:hypothetical protein